MAVSMKHTLLMYIFTAMASSSIRFVSSTSTSTSACARQFNTFIHDLRLQCPLEIPPSSPIEMDGKFLDNILSSSQMDGYTSVLFYASWCPFSNDFLPKYTALSAMFPRIKHIMVEESSTLPSVFSRYGIHSLPAVLMFNQTTRMRYHGSKDLRSLICFYKKTTGLDPVVVLTEEDQAISSKTGVEFILQAQNITFLKELISREPYLALSVLFLLFRATVLYLLSKVIARVSAIWAAHAPHLNLGIFGDSRQLLGRLLLLVDVKRIWSKLKFCKTRNFHRGARNARVWASSIASVSLGETSSARASSPSADL